MKVKICVAGKIACGKSTVAEAIMLHTGFPRISFGDILRKYSEEQGLPQTREVLQELGQKILDQHRYDGFLKWAMDHSPNINWNDSLIIDGLRHVAVYRRIIELFPETILVYCNCDIQTQIKRILSRDRITREEAMVDKVINFSKFGKGINRNTFGSILKDILKENKINKVFVPENFKIKYAEILKKNKIKIEVKPGMFFEARKEKNKKETECIATVQRVNEKAISKAIDLIGKSKIRKDKKLEFQGKILTSEFIKKIIDIEFLENNCSAEYNIVSCGVFSADPHESGKGPLIANQPIVIDIFPKSRESRYFSDMTRTVVRGKASREIKKIYETVLVGQKLALGNIKAGVKGNYIHSLVQDYFTKHGYMTCEKNGKVQGFIHGTGHGVGLDIHEMPSLSAGSETVLKPGNIVTVEPGLYYPGIGGVRIEDIVAVTKTGCKNLTKFPKVLEV